MWRLQWLLFTVIISWSLSTFHSPSPKANVVHRGEVYRENSVESGATGCPWTVSNTNIDIWKAWKSHYHLAPFWLLLATSSFPKVPRISLWLFQSSLLPILFKSLSNSNIFHVKYKMGGWSAKLSDLLFDLKFMTREHGELVLVQPQTNPLWWF